MTEEEIKELCFQKIHTENGFYYYSFSISGIDFISVGKDQVDDNEWYVDMILPHADKPTFRLYKSIDIHSIIKILSHNKI